MHIEKYKTAGVKGLAYHCERGGKEHSNENIDPERTKLNRNLKTFTLEGKKYVISKNNLDKLIAMHEQNTGKALRKDAPTVCSIVVTLPEEYKNVSQSQKKEFFSASFWGLAKKFGKKRQDGSSNLLWATVHYDETTPHMHFAFVPWDNKGKKISYKNVVNRSVYASLHTDIDKHLSETLDWYKGGILLPDEKKRTRAYNLKDSQVLNAEYEKRERALDERERALNEKEQALEELREEIIYDIQHLPKHVQTSYKRRIDGMFPDR